MSGHLSMGSILKNNRNLLRKKNSFLNSSNKNFTSSKNEIELKSFSEKELQILHKEFIQNKRTENRKLLITSLLIILPILLFGYFVINSLFQYKETELLNLSLQKEKEEQIIINNKLEQKTQKYIDYLNDGDNWIQKQNWKNAVYNYKKAVAIYPEKFEANYRLVLAYSYNCSFNNNDCEIGNKLNKRLLKYFPKNIDLIKLNKIFNK